METPAQRLLRNTRREAVLVLLVWAIFLAWVVGYSYLHGYVRAGEGAPESANLEMIFGVPRWAFYGIALPWIAATILTIIFGAAIIADDDLGGEHGEGRS